MMGTVFEPSPLGSWITTRRPGEEEHGPTTTPDLQCLAARPITEARVELVLERTGICKD